MDIQTIISFFVLVGHVILILGLIAYFALPNVKARIQYFSTNFGYILSFFIALFAMLGSLYFSEVIEWDPCVLCWYQRVAMYPLVVVFALGVWKQDASARMYGLALASIGLLISAYQIYLQVVAASGKTLSGFCSTVGAVNCSEIYMLEFGYITFPVLAATAFVFIIVLQLVRRVI